MRSQWTGVDVPAALNPFHRACCNDLCEYRLIAACTSAPTPEQKKYLALKKHFLVSGQHRGACSASLNHSSNQESSSINLVSYIQRLRCHQDPVRILTVLATAARTTRAAGYTYRVTDG